MLYKKIEIKSEADLSTEKGMYFVHKRREDSISAIYFHKEYKDSWIYGIDWYLRPVNDEDYLREELTKFIEYCAISWGYDFNFSIMETYLKKRKDEK